MPATTQHDVHPAVSEPIQAAGVIPPAAVAAIVAAVREHAGPLPQTFDQADAMKYVGLARSTWFRLRSADELPPPVAIPGSGPRWRRADLDAWLKKLKPARRKALPAEVGT